jgi:hypothetical protein
VIEAADRFVRGAGEFSDDRWVEKATHAVVVRSPRAHARIESITVSTALARSGVLAIFTGRDIAGHLRPLPCLVGLTSRDGRPRAEADRAILATDRVRHVGDGVAFVEAETLSQALDAAEAVQVIYELAGGAQQFMLRLGHWRRGGVRPAVCRRDACNPSARRNSPGRVALARRSSPIRNTRWCYWPPARSVARCAGAPVDPNHLCPTRRAEGASPRQRSRWMLTAISSR